MYLTERLPKAMMIVHSLYVTGKGVILEKLKTVHCFNKTFGGKKLRGHGKGP